MSLDIITLSGLLQVGHIAAAPVGCFSGLDIITLTGLTQVGQRCVAVPVPEPVQRHNPYLAITVKYRVLPKKFPLTLKGSVSDNVDGDISSQIVWTSSRDGTLGIGRKVVVTSLSLGKHVITAKISNSADLFTYKKHTVYIKKYKELTFDNKLDIWVDTREGDTRDITLPYYYRSQLRKMSSADRLREIRKRGCYSLI